MDDRQENKFSMFIKVQDYLTDNAADLATVAPVATKKTELDALISQIVDADAIATTDTTGYTEEKEDARQALGDIALKVARAAAAHFLNTGNRGLLREADLLKSELSRQRDTALYVKARKLFDIADPVKDDLVGYNSGPADVADLQTKSETYYAVLQNPQSKRGEKTASGKDVDVLISETDELLDDLDLFMDTFEATDLNLYNQYLAARAIDDLTGSGGGPSTEPGSGLEVVIGGIVTDPATGNPIVGAQLEFLPEGEAEAALVSTNAEGDYEYRISGLAETDEGDINITAGTPGYVSQSISLHVVAGNNYTQDFALVAE